MEAVALGVPTVSTDCPNGPREILQNGKYGRLIPVGDHRSMTQAMLDTLCNPPDPAVVREAAESYSLDESTSRYIEVLGLTEASS
jgi:glycosyltransferase involved in cell wall biosynthesis